MRLYTFDVTDAWVLDVASGRLVKSCAVTVPVQGGLTPPGFRRVFVLSDEARPGCGGAPPAVSSGSLRGDQLLDPILNWQAGNVAQPPRFTVATLDNVTPPNAGDGPSATHAHATPVALALALARALAFSSIAAGVRLRRKASAHIRPSGRDQ